MTEKGKKKVKSITLDSQLTVKRHSFLDFLDSDSDQKVVQDPNIFPTIYVAKKSKDTDNRPVVEHPAPKLEVSDVSINYEEKPEGPANRDVLERPPHESEVSIDYEEKPKGPANRDVDESPDKDH